MKIQLPLKQRLKLARQSVFAAIGFDRHVPVRIEQSPVGATIQVDGRVIHVPSPLRWKLYKYGWRARLDRLKNEYGVGRHIALTNESIVFDIGANAGEFAHLCAEYGARVYCFEPDPAVFQCLKKNITALDRVSAHDALIWKDDGERDFGLAPERADSSVFTENAPTIRKSAITVHTFCQQNAIPQIDLIKCDAEGAEPEVLEGIGDYFANIRVVSLDTGAERHGERTHVACRDILNANGFDVIDEKIGTRWMTYGVNRKFRADEGDISAIQSARL